MNRQQRDAAAKAVYEAVERHDVRCAELCPADCAGPVVWNDAPPEVRAAAYRVADAVLNAVGEGYALR